MARITIYNDGTNVVVVKRIAKGKIDIDKTIFPGDACSLNIGHSIGMGRRLEIEEIKKSST